MAQEDVRRALRAMDQDAVVRLRLADSHFKWQTALKYGFE